MHNQLSETLGPNSWMWNYIPNDPFSRNVHKNRVFLKACSYQSTGQRHHGECVAHTISAVGWSHCCLLHTTSSLRYLVMFQAKHPGLSFSSCPFWFVLNIGFDIHFGILLPISPFTPTPAWYLSTWLIRECIDQSWSNFTATCEESCKSPASAVDIVRLQ